MKKIYPIKFIASLLVVLLFQPVFANFLNPSDSIRLDLNKAIEIALSENPTMRIADRDIEVKKNYKKEQIIPLFPSVSATAGYNHTLQKQKMVMDMSKMTSGITDVLMPIYEALWEHGIVVRPPESDGDGGPMEVGTSHNWSIGINFSLPLVAPATWFNLKLSQLDVELSLENARSSKISLVYEVKNSYYRYLLAQDAYRVLLSNYENLQLTFENISLKFAQGYASELEKMRAEVQVMNQFPGLKSAERNVELSMMLLKVMIGVDVNEPIVFEGTLKDFEEKIKETPLPNANFLNLSDNPDLNRLDIAEKQLHIGIKILKSSSSPMLALSGVWQYSSMSDNFEFKNYSWFPYSYIAVGLNVPIMSWAGTAYKIKTTKLNLLNLKDQKQYLEDNLKTSVYNSINQISNALEELESSKETVLLAEKVYDISRKQYEVGLTTWLDLNAAELALIASKLSYNQSIYNYLSAYANYEKTIGK
jgi:outer membrane protein TolC